MARVGRSVDAVRVEGDASINLFDNKTIEVWSYGGVMELKLEMFTRGDVSRDARCAVCGTCSAAFRRDG